MINYQTVVDTDTCACSTGTECNRGYHASERTSYFQPVYQASHIESTASHELWEGVLPPNNWPADTSIQAHTPAQFNLSPFSLPPSLCVVPVPLHASGNASLHSDYTTSPGANSLISQHDLHTVTMPTPIRHAKYGGGLIDAERCYYEPSCGFTNENYMVEYSRAIPSIAMPMVPTIFGAEVPNYSDPTFPSGPPLLRASRHPSSTFQDLPPSNSAPSLTPSASFGSKPHPSPSPPFPVGSHSPVASRSETSPSDQIQCQPIITAPSDQLYTLTVPLGDVAFFPLIPRVGEMPFFRCRWGNCRTWITSDKEAVKDHLTRTHNVVLKNTGDSACCEWVGCSSSTQRSGLVRHFHTHLDLKWLCSVCKKGYARQDSLACHTRREARCELAQAISHPSAAAYRARINENDTVTLTKILQP